jgi:hypothetical protein
MTITQVQVLEHDTAQGTHNSLVQVDADTYALAYSGADNNGFLKTFTISADGMTITQVQVLKHDTALGKRNSLVQVDADTYALAYRGANSDGFLKTFTISADGMTITQVGVLEHDTSLGQDNSLVQVDADTYALAYRGANSAGFLKTFTISADGTTITQVQVLEHQSAEPQSQHNSLVQVDADTYALAYTGVGAAGFLKTFTISADGMTITQVQVLEHDTSRGIHNSLVQVDADTYALAYSGADGAGFLKTFTISVDGMTITQVQVLEHDTSAALESSLVQVDADTYALAYRGSDDGGFLKTFTIASECPTDLVLANQTMSGTQVFRSASTMTVGLNTTVPSGAALTLRSRTIRLEAGVSVQLGATLHADTSPDPCGNAMETVRRQDRVRVFTVGAAGDGVSNARRNANGVSASGVGGPLSGFPNKAGDDPLLDGTHTFLLIDEDSIDHATPPNFFSDVDVNADMAEIGLRERLLFFADHTGETLTLPTGAVGDEGWFALKTIPASWAAVGRTGEGLRNYLHADPGLGTPDRHGNPEALLAQIPDITPLRATGLRLLAGKQVCAVVYDQDVQVTYAPLTGSLQGATLGIVAFEILAVTESTASSPAALPQVEIQLLDADRLCAKELALFLDAPEPFSSSEPFDVMP